MKVYVVISGPDYYRHFDSVHRTRAEAKRYVELVTRHRYVTKQASLYGAEYYTKLSWVTRPDDAFGEIEYWQHPTSDALHGVIECDLDNVTRNDEVGR